jgi:hypothetical protein
MKTFAAAAFIQFSMAEKAVADATGNTFLQTCIRYVETPDEYAPKNQVEAFNQGFCAGSISATFNLTNKSCAPRGKITQGQAARVVVAYMQRHPELLHKEISWLAEEAFSEAWPCAESR